MLNQKHRIALFVAVPLVAAIIAPHAKSTPLQTTPANAQLKVGGAVATPLSLTAADLKSMPRKHIRVMNPHTNKTEAYEGVLLEEILRKAGAPHGEQLRGPLMATYVVAEAGDGYRVIFSLAELDPDFLDSEILVADTMDGAAIGADQGPLRLIAPHDKRPARWVRMLKSITVVHAPQN
jgi:DMSO/TMAO reductase YedYZ molybdopterin-dependent catalytic subunit